MLKITLVAILCNAQLCVEKVVTNSDQSDITAISCQMRGQAGVVEWMNSHPMYASWRFQGYRCVSGAYFPKGEA